MKQYDVYGIGNALLDIDVEVSTQSLTQLNVEKGVMTLIDSQRHHRLLKDLDGIQHLKACGGSGATTLYTMQQLGGRGFYSCRIANDEAGDFFYQNLVACGIDTNLTEDSRESGVTGACIVMVTPDADRTMNTFLGTTAQFSRKEISEYALRHSEYLYIEGYLLASPSACDAAFYARTLADKYHTKVAITLSDVNIVTNFRRDLTNIIGNQVDLLFCNEAEARAFAKCDDLDDAKITLKQFAKQFVITLGEGGSIAYDGQYFYDVPAFEVDVIDTVGAGDVFAGAFMYGITKGNYTFHEAAQIATLAASRVVSKFGPRLSYTEIQDVLAQVPEILLAVPMKEVA